MYSFNIMLLQKKTKNVTKPGKVLFLQLQVTNIMITTKYKDNYRKYFRIMKKCPSNRKFLRKF